MTDSNITMELEGQFPQEGTETPKWTWSPLYSPIHEDNTCPDCNNQIEHVSEHAIDGTPSLTVAQQYTQQFVKCEYDRGWDDCDKAQIEGHGQQIGCVHSTLQMLATCIVRTTRAIKQASENAADHAHQMNCHGFSPQLWEDTVRELLVIDHTLLLSLPKSNIVVYNDDVVISTPHGMIMINHENPSSSPSIQMVAIQVKKEDKAPNGC
ncbi:hypothetical protein EV363DRAFT_1296545 [Boletus edulis]|nr:hypothetical protein EV363DRAFT_1296545 [Boletus edulis]